jgi:hypothetical protein
LSTIESYSLDLEKVLNRSKDWSLNFEEMKEEKDFKAIESKS